MTTKTGKGRSISLQADLVESIRLVHVAQARDRLRLGVSYADEDLVFCQIDGRPHHPDYFSREWDRRVKRHGMKRIRLHDLRHTYATLALSAGVPAKVRRRPPRPLLGDDHAGPLLPRDTGC